MDLKQIYNPIKKELAGVEEMLRDSLKNTECSFISEVGNYLLDSKGKRLRPALVILSGKSVQTPESRDKMLIKIAAAMELIHIASLAHDDVIDRANIRHNRPTVNSKWDQGVSIALGDYLYSVAFELIADCGNSDIIRCISSAAKAMCEGEFIQVCERDNLDLLKERYLVIVKKKTASLFAASCQAGTLIFNGKEALQNTLKEYGLNFGIAFQITDDYLDVMCGEKELGKLPGQDISVGELTLPLLNLLESVPASEREGIKTLLASERSEESLKKIRARLFNSKASLKTEASISSYVASAKDRADILPSSQYKESLLNLADFVSERAIANSKIDQL